MRTYEPFSPGAEDTATYTNNVGFVSRRLGDLDTALRYYQAALELSESNDPGSMNTAVRWNNVGSVLQDLRELDRALHHYETALVRYRARTGRAARIEVARCLNNIASVRRELGDRDTARVRLDEAIRILAELAPRSRELASALGNAGFLADVLNAPQDAERFMRRALDVLQETGMARSATAAVQLNNLGGIHRDWGEYQAAFEYYRDAWDIHRALAPRSRETSIYRANTAAALYGLGRINEAIDTLADAIDIAEDIRSRVGDDRSREAVHGAQQDMYTEIQVWLSGRRQDGDAALALHYAERGRARVLSDLVARSGQRTEFRPDARDGPLDEDLRLQRELSIVYLQLVRAREHGETASIVVLEERENELIDRHGRLRARLHRDVPQLEAILGPAPLTAEEIRRELGASTLMLVYTVTEETLLAWSVRAGGVELNAVDCSAPRLRELVSAALAPYAAGTLGDEATASAQLALADILLAPVAHCLADGVDHVVVVPDGPLAYLPFELLPLPTGDLLVRTHTVSYSPSATVLDQTVSAGGRRNRRVTSFLGLGDPTFAAPGIATESVALAWFGGRLPALPGTRREVQSAARGFTGSTLLLGAQATEANLVRHVGGHDVVHLATHMVLDDERPLFAGLALAPPDKSRTDDDDLLQVFEMTRMSMNGALVVCSGCRTALGAIAAGEGIVGLSRALFAAGASCLVLSLWPVRDALAQRLMRLFYQALASGVGPGTALRQAKLTLLNSRVEAYADPYTWAAFIAVGNARPSFRSR